MIRKFAELRRRLVWVWRLASSAARLERDGGHRAALWVFDTRFAPDGYTLRPHVKMLAARESLRLSSFGPGARSPLAALPSFLRMSPIVLSPSFDGRFSEACRQRIAEEIQANGFELVVLGSGRGTFAAAASKAIERSKIWEVQHGLLDESYFPLHVGCFYSRSEASAKIVREQTRDVALQMLSRDLDPPSGHQERAKFDDAAIIACYSKNPGGGCTARSLASFERAVIDLARGVNRPLRLYLHPRDSLLKLLVRHKSLAPWRYVWTSLPRASQGRRLVISSYSTALTTNSACGDLLLNVRLGPLPAVVEAQYNWLPATDLDQLRKPTTDLQIFRRD